MPYESHPQLTTPPDETALWRYLNFTKFIDLLERHVLWFARTNTFEDHWRERSPMPSLRTYAR
jgi:hypothetical protein